MSQYPLILATLREFDLITEEQQQAAYTDWYEHMEAYEVRRNEFRNEWVARHEAKPWWRRISGFSEMDWMTEFYKKENEEASK